MGEDELDDRVHALLPQHPREGQLVRFLVREGVVWLVQWWTTLYGPPGWRVVEVERPAQCAGAEHVAVL